MVSSKQSALSGRVEQFLPPPAYDSPLTGVE